MFAETHNFCDVNLWMSKYCFASVGKTKKTNKKKCIQEWKEQKKEKREKKGAKAPPAAPHSACVLCVYCTSVWVYMRVCPIVCMCEFVLKLQSRDKTLFQFFFLNKKGKYINLVRFLKQENNLTRKFRLEKLHLKKFTSSFFLKIQREGERTFSFQPHFKVPIATFRLSLGPDVSYVHDLKKKKSSMFASERQEFSWIQENSGIRRGEVSSWLNVVFGTST